MREKTLYQFQVSIAFLIYFRKILRTLEIDSDKPYFADRTQHYHHGKHNKNEQTLNRTCQ